MKLKASRTLLNTIVGLTAEKRRKERIISSRINREETNLNKILRETVLLVKNAGGGHLMFKCKNTQRNIYSFNFPSKPRNKQREKPQKKIKPTVEVFLHVKHGRISKRFFYYLIALGKI